MVLMLLVVLALAAPLFLGKQAEQLFIKKVSSRFTTEFIIKGDIELSLLRNFPYASLSLKGVELRESLPNSRRNLLEAQKMSFLFGWWDLFRGTYKVERVNIENGALNLRTLLNGETNYRVFAPAPDDNQQPSETVSIQLKQ
ncbi:MAG TPA: AsmA family protein, partial [Chitinophagales bacterium]|nr:AsmA family protein [Chitinophagales bacterium]